MSALYNEIEPYAVRWLGNLIAAGHIAKGDVDDRSIADLRADDLVGRAQCHFFAGIGVWSHALRRAGWPDDRAVWTGSCPCQPFSAAGRGGGFDDERHLWPTWYALICECRPAAIFGEQVASPDGLKWLDLVHADLENAGYAVGVADLCAAGVGAPHIRQRTYFVAYADSNYVGERLHVSERQPRREMSDADRRGELGGMADADRNGRRGRTANARREAGRHVAGNPPGLVDASGARSGRHTGAVSRAKAQSEGERSGARYQSDESVSPGPTNGFWGDATWVRCRDGSARPVEPGTFPLAHGATARVGRLRAYGNAIVSEAAVTFIRAAMERAA